MLFDNVMKENIHEDEDTWKVLEPFNPKVWFIYLFNCIILFFFLNQVSIEVT